MAPSRVVATFNPGKYRKPGIASGWPAMALDQLTLLELLSLSTACKKCTLNGGYFSGTLRCNPKAVTPKPAQSGEKRMESASYQSPPGWCKKQKKS
jgi:hypothetical protein